MNEFNRMRWLPFTPLSDGTTERLQERARVCVRTCLHACVCLLKRMYTCFCVHFHMVCIIYCFLDAFMHARASSGCLNYWCPCGRQRVAVAMSCAVAARALHRLHAFKS